MISKKVLVPFVLAVVAVTAGCPGPQEMLRRYNSNQIAFCGTVLEAGRPVSGDATFRISAIHEPSAWVMNFVGTAHLDSRGVGCVNMVRDPVATGRYSDIMPADVSVESLSVTVGSRTVSGIFTFVDLNVLYTIYAEAQFDYATPNPGEPGMLARLHLPQLFERGVRSSAVAEETRELRVIPRSDEYRAPVSRDAREAGAAAI